MEHLKTIQKFGMTCGVSVINLMIVLPLLLYGCEMESSQGTSYFIFSKKNKSNNLEINVDTVAVKFHKNLTTLQPKEKDSLYITYYQNDTSIFIFNNIDTSKNNLSLVSKGYYKDEVKADYHIFSFNDIRFVDSKEYYVESQYCLIYKFKVDELKTSNSLKYFYYLDGFGFICIDYYYENILYTLTNVIGVNKLSQIKLDSIQQMLLSDSLFYERMNYLSPPVMP